MKYGITMFKKIYKPAYIALCTLMPSCLFGASSSDRGPSIRHQEDRMPSLQELCLQQVAKNITPYTDEIIPTSFFSAVISTIRSFLPSFYTASGIQAESKIIQAKIIAKDLREEDLHTIIDGLCLPDIFVRDDGPRSDYISLKDALFNRLAKIIATEYFLCLPTDRMHRHPDRLPEWLQSHFSGISVQDLIDHDLLPRMCLFNGMLSLDLKFMFINDLTGLNNMPKADPSKFMDPRIDVIKHLDLSFNNLTNLAPYSFAGLRSLEYLNVESNRISTLAPKAFAECSKLSVLLLQGNNLTVLTPEMLAGPTRLYAVDLENNNLSIIAPGTFTTSPSSSLSLRYNPISAHPEERARIEGEVHNANNRCIIDWERGY